ncbi:integrase core domain-containing protein [Legionella sp. W05-934-2]|uniref:integrase core domain-containing protein n=1 Tax=Legionella sp. W05-934-2 TaxID=1198649 RepID=UPI0034617BFF
MVERLIRICRNELFDQTLFWTKSDLEAKLALFQIYFNENRPHLGVYGYTPNQIDNNDKAKVIDIINFRWKIMCRGLFQLPIAA